MERGWWWKGGGKGWQGGKAEEKGVEGGVEKGERRRGEMLKRGWGGWGGGLGGRGLGGKLEQGGTAHKPSIVVEDIGQVLQVGPVLPQRDACTPA